MADTEKAKKKQRKTLKITGVVLLLVLAVGAGVALRMMQQSENTAPQTPTPQLPKVVDDLQNLRDSGDEVAFNTALQKALADSPDNQTKYLVYIQEGHYAMQNQQWQTAIDAYTKAMNLKRDKEAAALLGEAYAALGNKAKAVAFYQQAIELIPADSPNYEGAKQEYELRIQEIEQGAQP